MTPWWWCGGVVVVVDFLTDNNTTTTKVVLSCFGLLVGLWQFQAFDYIPRDTCNNLAFAKKLHNFAV